VKKNLRGITSDVTDKDIPNAGRNKTRMNWKYLHDVVRLSHIIARI